MDLILQRSLVFVGLMIAGLVLYSLMFSIKADRYDEIAIPYLNRAIPELASWEFSRLEPLLSPQGREIFKTEQGQSIYRLFRQLGELKSFDKPQYLSEKLNENDDRAGDINLVTYSVPAEFEAGPALITLSLLVEGKTYSIYQFGIHSEIFADKL